MQQAPLTLASGAGQIRPAPPSSDARQERREHRRPSLLIASPWPYHPDCGIGGGVLCFRLLERLAATFDIHFISFDQVANDPEAGRRALAARCASVTILPAPRPVRGLGDRWLQLVQVARRAPREVRDLRSAEMAAAIADLVAAHAPTAAILQFPPMAQYVDAAGAVPVLMDTQDVAMVSRFREWRAAPGALRRATRLVAWLAWARHELHWYARADALLALSENDLGVLRSFLPDVPSFHSAVAAEPAMVARRGKEPRAVFIGNFDHAPNRDALAWLVEEIWPRVREQVPAAELHIAGSGVPAPAARAGNGVVVHGFVESLDAFHAEARVAVVPYRFGGGTKIKALDAMAYGCPVVATTIGAEGLQVTPGEHMLVADDAAGFAEAVVRLLRRRSAGEALAEAALAHVARHFAWDAKVAKLTELLHGLPARRQRQAARRRGPVQLA